MKYGNLLLAVLSAITLSACGGSQGSAGSTTSASVNSALSSQLQSAEVAGNWVNQSSGITLTIGSDGSFASGGCNTGTLTNLDPDQPSQCPSGVATCGIAYINVTSSTGASGCLNTGVADCAYETAGNELLLNCGGGEAGSAVYQRE